MRTASSRRKPNRNACWRKSDDVSTRTVWPPCSMITETRRRLSRGSSERHVSHSQPIDGTPVEVPVPRKVSFILVWSLVFGVRPLALVESSVPTKGQRPKAQGHLSFLRYPPPPVISPPVKLRVLGVALDSETNCMRRSESKLSSICFS
jgi:hypothetical protein